MLTPWDESERKPLAESFNTGAQWPRYEAFFQQRAGGDLLFGEPGSSFRKCSVFELRPDIL